MFKPVPDVFVCCGACHATEGCVASVFSRPVCFLFRDTSQPLQNRTGHTACILPNSTGLKTRQFPIKTDDVEVVVGSSIGTVGSLFGLTADSSSFLVDPSTTRSLRWTALRSKKLRTMLAGLAPLTFRVGGTFTDMTLMPGPNPGVSPKESKQYNFSVVGWRAMNELVQALPGSQLVVSLNGLLRHWNQSGIRWDAANANAFIAANIANGYQIYGCECHILHPVHYWLILLPVDK